MREYIYIHSLSTFVNTQIHTTVVGEQNVKHTHTLEGIVFPDWNIGGECARINETYIVLNAIRM